MKEYPSVQAEQLGEPENDPSGLQVTLSEDPGLGANVAKQEAVTGTPTSPVGVEG